MPSNDALHRTRFALAARRIPIATAAALRPAQSISSRLKLDESLTQKLHGSKFGMPETLPDALPRIALLSFLIASWMYLVGLISRDSRRRVSTENRNFPRYIWPVFLQYLYER
jgi:hypothetical protein